MREKLMETSRFFTAITIILTVFVFVLNVSVSNAAPENNYCGSWNGLNLSADTLWKTIRFF
jgi:hypothetical protein